MYQFATWKYWLVIIVLLVFSMFALPNVFGRDPALQLSRSDRKSIDEVTTQRVLKVLEDQHIKPNAQYVEGDRLVVRLNTEEDRAKARTAIQENTAGDYTVARSSSVFKRTTRRSPSTYCALGLMCW